MMNARIYYARANPAGLVAGGAIPADYLERARTQEERARTRARAVTPDEACPGGVAAR
jgi:hypothetical protein